MTRRSIEKRLEELENDAAGSDGFHLFQIGGDPDPDAGGRYSWSSSRGAYVNVNGHEIPASEAPDSGGEVNLRNSGAEK
jgi:Cu/Zn superoxide dismutase